MCEPLKRRDDRTDETPTKFILYQEHAMDLFFYVLFAVVMIGAIYFIVRGKRT